MTDENDLLDQMELFSKDPEKAMNDMIFENFGKVIHDDDFRESVIKKGRKLKQDKKT